MTLLSLYQLEIGLPHSEAPSGHTFPISSPPSLHLSKSSHSNTMKVTNLFWLETKVRNIILPFFLGVGKSSLIAKATVPKIDYQTNISTGQFITKCDSRLVRLQIWDTRSTRTSRIKSLRICKERADCIFLCYDITQLETFNSVKEWYKTFK